MKHPALPGIVALGSIGLLVGGAFIGLLFEASGNWSGAVAAFNPYLFRITRFTLWQAALSTLLSVAPAIFVARALARHPTFPGRGLILGLFAVPMALPAIVAALAILALLGRAGYLASLLAEVTGEEWPGIYGLSGILIAHVFFNLPLATRLLLEALQSVSADQWRLSAQLGMGGPARFRFIEWPALRSALPGAASLVFMLCVTSFTIVLLLGGGPAATTLEVAIYQSLRFDFDPARAVALTLLQVALALAAIALMARFGASLTGEANIAVAAKIHARPGRPETALNAAIIVAALALVGAPLAATVAAGLRADLARLAGEASVQRALATSLVLASSSALLATMLSLGLVIGRARTAPRRGARPSALNRLLDSGALGVLVVPPIVIGAGWFVLLRHTGAIFAVAPFMVVAVNAVMATPFAVRALRPAYDASTERHDRLAAQLGISGISRFRLIDWPVLRRPLATALAFALALSLGDLGVIALFGSDQVKTLPYLLLERMGAYRTADAAGIALFLGAVCLGLSFLSSRLGRGEQLK